MVEVTKWSRVFTHDTLTLEFYQKVTQLIVMGVNFIIGLLYRILLYKNVWDNGVLSRPINLMTCIDETVKMFGYSTWMFLVGSNFFFYKPMYTFTGELFCHATNYVVVVGFFHGYNGGCGIALMRMLFVQFPTKIHFSQRNLGHSVLLGDGQITEISYDF